MNEPPPVPRDLESQQRKMTMQDFQMRPQPYENCMELLCAGQTWTLCAGAWLFIFCIILLLHVILSLAPMSSDLVENSALYGGVRCQGGVMQTGGGGSSMHQVLTSYDDHGNLIIDEVHAMDQHQEIQVQDTARVDDVWVLVIVPHGSLDSEIEHYVRGSEAWRGGVIVYDIQEARTLKSRFSDLWPWLDVQHARLCEWAGTETLRNGKTMREVQGLAERVAARGHKLIKAFDSVADLGLVGDEENTIEVEHVECVSWKSLLLQYKPLKWNMLQMPYDMCASVQFNHLPPQARRPVFIKLTGSPILGEECQQQLKGQGYEHFQRTFGWVMWRQTVQEHETYQRVAATQNGNGGGGVVLDDDLRFDQE